MQPSFLLLKIQNMYIMKVVMSFIKVLTNIYCPKNAVNLMSSDFHCHLAGGAHYKTIDTYLDLKIIYIITKLPIYHEKLRK